MKNIRYKVRKGDVVTVLAGKEKGKSGKVLSVLPKKGLVLVEKVNFVKKHTKPSQQVPQGGILEKESPLPVSKVMVLDPHTNTPSRFGRKRLADGSLVRLVKKTGEVLEPMKS